jgi:hypothetical protein
MGHQQGEYNSMPNIFNSELHSRSIPDNTLVVQVFFFSINEEILFFNCIYSKRKVKRMKILSCFPRARPALRTRIAFSTQGTQLAVWLHGY